MSTPTLNPIYQRYPFELRGQPEEVVQAHRYAFQQLVDVNQAIAALNTKVNTNTSTMAAALSTTNESVTQTITGNSIVGLMGVNNQTGSTSYTTLQSDNGILLILNDASAIAVTLNSALTTPYGIFITSLGAGVVTLTPTTGTINGSAALTLTQNEFILVAFDGANWWSSGSPILPQTISPVTGEYLTGYNSGTGLFSVSTPAGISATITTAALTIGGTQGSQTFVGGRLTAQVQAT